MADETGDRQISPAPLVAELEVLLAESRLQQARIRDALTGVLALLEGDHTG